MINSHQFITKNIFNVLTMNFLQFAYIFFREWLKYRMIFLHYMKRLFAIFVTLIFVGAPTRAFASSESELLGSIKATFTEDISGSGAYSFSADAEDQSFISGKSVVDFKFHSGDWESHGDIDVLFDTTLAASFFPEPIPALTGILKFGHDTFYNQQDKFLWAKLREPSLTITKDESGMDIKAIAEGIFEFTKFFTDKYVVVDFQQAIEDMASDSTTVAEIRSQLESTLAIYDNYGDFIADTLQILLDSGVLVISKDRAQYILTLAQTPDNLYLEKLGEFMTLFGATEEDIQSFAAMIKEQDPMIRQAWTEIVENIDFKLRFSTTPLKLSLISFNLTAKLPTEIVSEATIGETPQTSYAFTAAGSMSLSDEPTRVSFPMETKVIDIAKFLKGIAALAKQSNAE